MSKSHLLPVAAVTAGLCLLSACGGGEGSKGAGSIEKALAYESKQRAAAQAADEKAAAAVRAKKEAEKAAEEAKWAEVDAASAPGPNDPTDVGKACEAMVEALDAFMRRGDDEAVLTWVNEGRGKKMSEQKSKCLQRKNLAMAVCQLNALSKAPASFDQHKGLDVAREILMRCVKKHEAGAPPAKAG